MSCHCPDVCVVPQEYGLVVVGGEEGEEDEEDATAGLSTRQETEEGLVLPRPVPMKRVLLTQDAADILDQGAARGSLGESRRRGCLMFLTNIRTYEGLGNMV